MFSAFDAVLIRPLPYADADRLVMIWDGWERPTSRLEAQPTPAEWLEWRRLNTVFTDIAATQPATRHSRATASPNRCRRARSRWTFWSVLGVQPMLGRVFTEDEDARRARGGDQPRTVAAPLRRRARRHRPQDHAERRARTK